MRANYLVVIYLCLINLSFAQASEMIMCVDHYPPLQVILPNGDVTGENVEVVKAFTSRIGVTLKFTANTPFKRCLKWLKEGRVDIMSGLLFSKEREQDYHMFLYDDLTEKTFFIRKNTVSIEGFDDLKGLNIASLRGTRQFKKFDEAPTNYFNKIEVGTLLAAFSMLQKGRVDAVVTTDYYGQALLKQEPEFRSNIVKSEYNVSSDTQVYIAVSKQSKLADDVESMTRIANEMYKSGAFIEVMLDFQKNAPQYYDL